MSKATDKHYRFDYKGHRIDPYRILDLYKITNPAQQHAIKKLLRAGQSNKPLRQDVEEVLITLNRWLAMMDEDENGADAILVDTGTGLPGTPATLAAAANLATVDANVDAILADTGTTLPAQMAAQIKDTMVHCADRDELIEQLRGRDEPHIVMQRKDVPFLEVEAKLDHTWVGLPLEQAKELGLA